MFKPSIFFLIFVCLLGDAKAKELTWEEVMPRVLTYSPRLKMAEAEVHSRHGQNIQAELYPNPLASYSVENVFGNANWRGWQAAESRYELAQLIETGWKRYFRSQDTIYQFFAALSGFDAMKLQVLNGSSRAFITLIAAQEQYQIALEQQKIASKMLAIVTAKVEAGKVSLIQEHKAKIALATAEIQVEKQRADMCAAQQNLALMWGTSEIDFETAIFPFYEMEVPPELATYLCRLAYHPELAKAQYEFRALCYNLSLEKSQVIPDLTLTLGYKTDQERHDKGMIFGASLPLPLFNQNQGNIEKARAELTKGLETVNLLEATLENKIYAAHCALLQSYRESQRLKKTLVESATQSFMLAQEGYREGKFEYLDMLDAQRTLFEVNESYIESLKNFHLKHAQLKFLTSQENA
ncbi:MAG: hypothetical protein CK425_04105 [Parachlamydia sp.]|nr:MAG: hypothetical protein CK425_04105 [Parachlamydia sp.]